MRIDWPRTRTYWPRSCQMELRDNARVARSEETGTTQVSERPGSRWIMTLGWTYQKNSDRDLLAAKLAEGLGRINTWGMVPFHRPNPKGQMSGVVLVALNAPQGGSELQIVAASGSMFLPGDWMSVNGQLLCVTSCAPLGGMLLVRFAPRLKAAVLPDAAVTWSFPTGEFRLTSSGVAVPWEPRTSPGFSATFEEVI